MNDQMHKDELSKGAPASSGGNQFAACRALIDPSNPLTQGVPARIGLFTNDHYA